jgi:hypothetical protein
VPKDQANISGQSSPSKKIKMSHQQMAHPIKSIHYFSAFFAAAFFAPVLSAAAGLASLVLPNDPLKIFPFLVFLSPLPIKFVLNIL